MNIRPVRPGDATDWRRMRQKLWPSAEDEHDREIARYFEGETAASRDPTADPAQVFMAFDSGQRALGFLEVSIRSHADGCTPGHIGYLEGIFVEPDARRRGVARRLVEMAHEWARSEGCTELASDAAIDNHPSQAMHRALGFEEAARNVCYRKSL